MANYTYNPSTVYPTSSIPVFYVNAEGKASVSIKLYRSSTCIFSTTLYAVEDRAIVRDLRQIIEQDMIDGYFSQASYSLQADGTTVSEFVALYCDRVLPCNTSGFLTTRYLTSSSSKQMARERDELYYYVYKSETDLTPRVFVAYRDAEGKPHILDKVLNERAGANRAQAKTVTVGGIYSIEVDPAAYASLGTVLAITTMVGKRSFTHYYTDHQPSLKLFFLNAFNLPEQIQLDGITTRKTEVKRSEAVIHRTTSFYDQTVTELREFESAPLTKQTASTIAELVASHEVHIIDEDYEEWDDLPTILITDSSVELSDEQASLSSVKFTYRYADESPHMDPFPTPSQPFINTYSLPYT